MNCDQTTQQIETLNLTNIKPLATELENHIKQCEQCMKVYQSHSAYLASMQSLKTPSLHPAKAARLLEQAGQQAKKTATKSNSFVQGFIAASVIAVSVFGTYTTLENRQTPSLVQQTEYIDQNVTIVIHANDDLYDAELDLILPEQVAIAGFEKIQQLTWPVDLKAGANTLELPIRVNMNKAIEQPISIMATLYHEADERNFEIGIDLTKKS